MMTTITSVTLLAPEIQSETLCNQSQRPLTLDIAGIKQQPARPGKIGLGFACVLSDLIKVTASP